MEYTDNQNLGTSYEPEVAMWCNENNAYIEQVGEEFFIRFNPQPTKDELALEELEQQENTLNAQIAELKDNLLTATLADDTNQVESIKAQYQTLVGGE